MRVEGQKNENGGRRGEDGKTCSLKPAACSLFPQPLNPESYPLFSTRDHQSAIRRSCGRRTALGKSRRGGNMDVVPEDIEYARIRRNAVAWYARHARDLPWRRTTDPYRIWISEIMLQQTTVKAVVGYYERFLREFPTVEALAAAPEESVLRQWEGLGYYTRARNLHRAAGVVVRELSGRFPQEVDELLRLPGIGRYTAGAVASFAFDRPAPIVEANTQRLYSRLLGYAGDLRSSTGQRVLWQFAERLVPHKSPGRFNQALMELGATVCAPVDPQCDRCPMRRDCAALRHGRQNEIPLAHRRPEPTDVTEAAVAVRSQDAFLLLQRPAGQRWAGLWDFPRFA